MDDDPIEEQFDSLVARYDGRPGVSYGRTMASNGLRIDGKIFAMLVRGRLVLKLPSERVAMLVADGSGEPFEPRPGRRMKEWIRLDAVVGADWNELTAEAVSFVGGRRQVDARDGDESHVAHR